MGDKDPGRRSGKKADASTEIAQLMQQLKAKDEQVRPRSIDGASTAL